MTEQENLLVVLTRQVAQVEAIEGRSANIHAAAITVVELVALLGLAGFKSSLVHEPKNRFVLRFSRVASSDFNPDGDVVLKVYGDARRGEGALQHLWVSKGVPTPDLIYGVHNGCSWLLLEHRELRAAAQVPESERLRLTDELGALDATLHEAAAGMRHLLRPLHEVMLPRLSLCADALASSGTSLPRDWYARATRAYCSSPVVPLHGDLGLNNVALDAAGGLVLIDASALAGPSAFDAARWAARASGSASPETLLERWSVRARRSPQEAYELLVAECILEAGAVLIVAARGNQQSRAVARVASLLGTAKALS